MIDFDKPGKNKLIKGVLRFVWQVDLPVSHRHDKESVHLDIGAGMIPRNPFHSLRLVALDSNENYNNSSSVEHVFGDLTQELPFDDNTFSSISAYDVLEHIPRWERRESGIHYPFVSLMNEIYRILKPGAIFIAITPAFPSPAAFADPTHVNLIARDTIRYFAGDEAWARTIGYGFNGNFEVVAQTWLREGGPYAPNSILGEISGISRVEKLKTMARLFMRTIRLLKNRNPSHILWVLRKKP